MWLRKFDRRVSRLILEIDIGSILETFMVFIIEGMKFEKKIAKKLPLKTLVFVNFFLKELLKF